MKTRLEALTVRESDGKSYWTKIGVAFIEGDKGTILLDAMPAPTEGQFKIILRPPQPKRDDGGNDGAPF